MSADEPLHCDKCGTTEFRDEYVSGRNKGLSLVHSVLEKIKELKNSQGKTERCWDLLKVNNVSLPTKKFVYDYKSLCRTRNRNPRFAYSLS